MKAFENAKVGDKVFCLLDGDGIITRINNDMVNYPITVEFKSKKSVNSFTIDGKCDLNSVHPTLYYGEPDIIAPERPKKLIDKTIIMYCNVYRGNNIKQLSHRKEDTIRMANKAIDKPIFTGAEVTIKYQIEE